MPEPIKLKIPTAVKLASLLNYAAAFSPIVILWSLFYNPSGSYLSFNSNLHSLLLGPTGSLLFTFYFGSGFLGGGLSLYFIALSIYCLFILYVANGLGSGVKFTRKFQMNLSLLFMFFSGISLYSSIIDIKYFITIYIFLSNLLLYWNFRNSNTVNEFFLSGEKFFSRKGIDKISIVLSLSYIIFVTLILLYLNNKGYSQLELNKSSIFTASSEQEMVMNKGMKITAEAPEGIIEIFAEDSFVRTYSWGSCIRTQTLFPRKKRWHGSFGAYFSGPNPSWKLCDRIDGSLLEEGQMHFNTVDEALLWINSGSQFRKGSSVYSNDGLLVSFEKSINSSRKSGTMVVTLWQIFINGSKPNGLNGSDDRKLVINHSSSTN